jgi:mRNA interferase MazF
LRRGEIWTVSGGPEYSGKPRPAVIIQDDDFDGLRSVTICGFTSDPNEAPIFRIPVAPSEGNGLREPSHLMVDKLITIPRTKLGTRIGHMTEDEMVRLNQAILVFLGLARSRRLGASR